MSPTSNALLWLLLGVSLFFVTFGEYAIFIGLCGLAFLAGTLVIIYNFGKQATELDMPEISLVVGQLGHGGIEKVKSAMEPTTKIKNFDKRMTGASVIDDVLKEVLQFAVKDYIKTWYRQISDHDSFLVDIWQCVQKVIITFSNRSKEIDWMPYFTQQLVDDFASHIRLYRRAAEKTGTAKTEDNAIALENAFFDMEVEMENNMCRDLVCLDPQAERQYLQDLSEVLLYLLLPKEDFHNKPFRYIVREVLVNGIFMPTIDLLSDPDYINQYIVWMCYETSFTRETFLTVIRCSDCMEELEAVKEMVDSDIAKWRSKDTGGSDDTTIKQNLNSLMFLKNACEMRMRRLKSGPVSADQIIEPENLRNLYVLSLDEIFSNNFALQSFIEYVTSRNGQQYLYFYLNVEGFRAAAEQQISEMQKQSLTSVTSLEPDLEPLRNAAKIIFDQYLSEKATSRLKIEPEFIKDAVQKLKSKMLSEDTFDLVQARVYQILHMSYYEDFLQSTSYQKLLGELGLNSTSAKAEEGDNLSYRSIEDVPRIVWCKTEDLLDPQLEDIGSDTVSIGSGSSATSVGSPSADAYMQVTVTNSGVLTEKNGKSYAIFFITVKKKDPYSEQEDGWDVYRRYSDFHDLHMILTEKFPELVIPSLPSKTIVKNMSESFLEKRRKDLDKYLRYLMKPDLIQNVSGLEDLMNHFLHNSVWEKHKSEFSRKMDTIVHPLKKGIGDGLGKVFTQRNIDQSKSREIMNQMKVGAGLDPEAGENIPLRIMLLMMDEVFDLRHKNQWLRRRIVAILRQLIKATFGDKINRKIVEHVDLMTSAEQMAEYILAFKNSFWPNGVLAEPRQPRDEATKMRTKVLCKAKMLGSVPDEVRTLMGTDAVRMGVARVFQMFQHKTLNKRILYVVLEGVLVTLFPDNKFQAIFRKLHSRSKRAEKVLEAQKAGTSQDSQLRKRQLKR
ncbi:sorting nexin-13-like isoform X2 [Biomphalaria glabrata]|uniref:Sorting nexin-13-like isoform X2 n=1 Tax=Biomphalaria glabrata TaxID=6526 RepID=A0A9W2ZGY4_BIOGL|nr:sorting nexin-13-like isoform X2 [Biomphalaria glabrata]